MENKTMLRVIDLEAVRAKQEVIIEELTPEMILHRALPDSATYRAVALIAIEQDGNITLGYSGMNQYELIGFLESVKSHVVDQIREN